MSPHSNAPFSRSTTIPTEPPENNAAVVSGRTWEGDNPAKGIERPRDGCKKSTTQGSTQEKKVHDEREEKHQIGGVGYGNDPRWSDGHGEPRSSRWGSGPRPRGLPWRDSGVQLGLWRS